MDLRRAQERLARTLVRSLNEFSLGNARAPDANRLCMLVELDGRAAGELADEVIPEFVAGHREQLAALYHAYRDDSRATPLLYAADALLIFELLERNPDRLRREWARWLPIDELEDLASTYGVAL